jgi:hypothetical protein
MQLLYNKSCVSVLLYLPYLSYLDAHPISQRRGYKRRRCFCNASEMDF